MSRQGNLAKNTIILSIGTFLPKFAGFITLPILTGFLSKEEYGTYDLITLLVSLLLPELTLQIHTAAFRFLLDVRDDSEKQKKIISNIFAVVVSISFIVLPILYFVLPGNSVAIKIGICFYYLSDILVCNVRQASRGIGKNLPYSISAVISATVKMIFAFILVKIMNMGLLGAVIALGSGAFCSLIYISIKINVLSFITLNRINKATIKELISYSWPMVPNDMSMWVMNASDRFIITKIFGVSVNALYAAATKIPSLINLAQSALLLAWTENASISASDKDSDSYYTEMFKTMLNLQAGFFCAVIGAMPVLFKILIKGDYNEAYTQMPILCYGIFFQGMAFFLGGIFVAKKAVVSVGITSMGSAIINILVNLMFIHRIWIFAASISTLVSYIILFLYRLISVQKYSKVKVDIKQFLILQVLMIIEVVICYQQNYVCNIINAIIGISIFAFLNREMLLTILKKINRKINNKEKCL